MYRGTRIVRLNAFFLESFHELDYKKVCKEIEYEGIYIYIKCMYIISIYIHTYIRMRVMYVCIHICIYTRLVEVISGAANICNKKQYFSYDKGAKVLVSSVA